MGEIVPFRSRPKKSPKKPDSFGHDPGADVVVPPGVTEAAAVLLKRGFEDEGPFVRNEHEHGP